jgi:hypothetical protein
MPRVALPKRSPGVSSAAPTKELGTILQGVFSIEGMEPWRNFVDDNEFIPELIWPRSVSTYNMVRTDAQVSALYRSVTLPLLRKGTWSINPNGVDDNGAVQRLSDNLNLPIQGEKTHQPIGRMKNRFNYYSHVRKSRLSMLYGHYPFEQVGKIDKDGLWTLTRLSERPPRTIADFRISPDGDLISIIQNVSPSGLGMRSTKTLNPMGPFPEIPVDNLVMYVMDQEGANWAGRSMLRDIYKNWLLKDRLMRVDAINHERAGGVPYVEAHQDATGAEMASLQQFASAFRIGDSSGGAVPYGAKVQIARATGSNVIQSIQYHDEAMARNWLMMILQLGGSKTGSRNLGSTFVEFFSEGVNAIGEWQGDVFNAEVVEDYWDWNYGEDQKHVPRVEYESDPEMNATDISLLIKTGAIEVDDELEDAIRKDMALPRKGTPRPNQVLLPTALPDTGETPDGASSPATTSKNKPEGGEQLSQNEKQSK